MNIYDFPQRWPLFSSKLNSEEAFSHPLQHPQSFLSVWWRCMQKSLRVDTNLYSHASPHSDFRNLLMLFNELFHTHMTTGICSPTASHWSLNACAPSILGGMLYIHRLGATWLPWALRSVMGSRKTVIFLVIRVEAKLFSVYHILGRRGSSNIV